MNISIEQINHDIFVMFNQEEIKLTKVPTNVLYYTIQKELTDELIADIHSTLKHRMESRLSNFEKLVSAIKSKSDPIKIISDHLGISN